MQAHRFFSYPVQHLASSQIWLACLVASSSLACDTDTPTTALIENDWAPSEATPPFTVYRVWYQSTLFFEPLAFGESSAAQRIVNGSAYAYALVALDFDPLGGGEPRRFLALRSHQELSVKRGDLLQIELSDETFDGNCFAGKALSQTDANFITERIFPGNFAGQRYDAESCETHAIAEGGGGLGGSGS
jgi:hypothetical protein